MKQRRTVVKVIGRDGVRPTSEDIEKWRKIILNKEMTLEEASATGEVFVESHEVPDDEGYLTLVKIGSGDYKPTIADLESFRQLFEEIKDEPNPIIFVAVDVEIDVINIGKIVSVE